MVVEEVNEPTTCLPMFEKKRRERGEGEDVVGGIEGEPARKTIRGDFGWPRSRAERRRLEI